MTQSLLTQIVEIETDYDLEYTFAWRQANGIECHPEGVDFRATRANVAATGATLEEAVENLLANCGLEFDEMEPAAW